MHANTLLSLQQNYHADDDIEQMINERLRKTEVKTSSIINMKKVPIYIRGIGTYNHTELGASPNAS